MPMTCSHVEHHYNHVGVCRDCGALSPKDLAFTLEELNKRLAALEKKQSQPTTEAKKFK
jgi:hypothetical protein